MSVSLSYIIMHHMGSGALTALTLIIQTAPDYPCVICLLWGGLWLWLLQIALRSLAGTVMPAVVQPAHPLLTPCIDFRKKYGPVFQLEMWTDECSQNRRVSNVAHIALHST